MLLRVKTPAAIEKTPLLHTMQVAAFKILLLQQRKTLLLHAKMVAALKDIVAAYKRTCCKFGGSAAFLVIAAALNDAVAASSEIPAASSGKCAEIKESVNNLKV